MSSDTATFKTTAFLLVASGIKNLYLSDVVALCSNCVVISIHLAFSILLRSSSNSFDLSPVSSTIVIDNVLRFFICCVLGFDV